MPSLKQTGFPWGQSRLLSGILLLTVICWLPYFVRTVVPVHDSLYVTESFHCFYSAARCHGELARWLPYGNYGVPADFCQLALHPTHYAVGAAGLILGVDDTLLLSKVAMLVNELLFALGLFLLSRELYALPLTQFLVSIGGVLSVSWFQQVMFNLFLFYLLPLVMYLVLRFFKTEKPTYLFVAGITEICSLLGNVTYAVPLHFWVLFIFAAALACEHRRALQALVTRKTFVNPWLWVFLAVVGIVGCFMAGTTANLTIFAPGRDPTTGRATLETFLDYGRPPMSAALFGIITGGIPHCDNTYYIGLFPLAMFAYALVTESRLKFLGIAFLAVALIWLTMGGWFASLIFWLPGMNLYRHVALVYGLIGMLLLLGAGFGFERLALRLADRETERVAHPFLRAAFLIVLAGTILADFYFCRLAKDSALPALTVIPGWQLVVWLRVAVYVFAIALVSALCLKRRGWSTKSPLLPACVLGLAFLFDIGSYRLKVVETIPPIDLKYAGKSVFHPVKLPYRAARGELPLDERAQNSVELLAREVPPIYNATYCLLSEFAGVDPCQPTFRADMLSCGIDEMIRARGGKLEPWPGPEYLPPADAAFKRSLGCGAPKLRLTDRPLLASTDADAVRMFASLADPDQSVVLSPGPGIFIDEPSRGEPRAGEGPKPGSIEVTEFSPNRLRARVVVESTRPVWLVYADAWNPGWRARIDGVAALVRRANVGFKAVRLESGAHDVEFYYSARKRTALAWGLALVGTLSGMTLCCAVLAAGLAPLVGARRFRVFVAAGRASGPSIPSAARVANPSS